MVGSFLHYDEFNILQIQPSLFKLLAGGLSTDDALEYGTKEYVIMCQL